MLHVTGHARMAWYVSVIYSNVSVIYSNQGPSRAPRATTRAEAVPEIIKLTDDIRLPFCFAAA